MIYILRHMLLLHRYLIGATGAVSSAIKSLVRLQPGYYLPGYRRNLSLCRHIFSVIIFYSWWSASPGIAQEEHKKDDQALAELSRAFELLGGNSPLAHSDVTISGTLTIEPSGAPMKQGDFTANLRGRSYLLTNTVEGHTVSYSNINEQVLAVSNGRLRAMPASHGAGRTSGLFPIFDRWTDYRRSNSIVKIEGVEQFNAHTCIHIHLEAAALTDHQKDNRHGTVEIYIQQDDGLLSGYTVYLTEGINFAHAVKTTYAYAGYDRVQGLLFPRRITRTLDGTLNTVFYISNAVFGRSMSDADLLPSWEHK